MKKSFFRMFLAISILAPLVSHAEAPLCRQVFRSNYFRDQRALNKGLPERLMMKAIKLNKLEDFYDRLSALPAEGRDFWSEIIKQLDVRLHYSPEQLAKIPKTGGLVMVSNHPFGGVDGISAVAMMHEVRKDVKILMTDEFGEMVPQIAGDIIGVNLSGSREARVQNLKKIEVLRQWVRDGHVIMIFPAGEISRAATPNALAYDSWWKPTAGRIARETGAQILPLNFEGGNSALFQGLSILSERMREKNWPTSPAKGTTRTGKLKGTASAGVYLLRKAAIVANITNKMGKDIILHIGDPISQNVIAKFTDDKSLADFMQLQSYALADNPKLALTAELLNNGDFVKGTQTSLKQKTLLGKDRKLPVVTIQPVDTKLVAADVDFLRRTQPQTRLFSPEEGLKDDAPFSVFISDAKNIPNVVTELGNLRGADKYDRNYDHLFVWDNVKNQVAGSYRLGFTYKLLKTVGLEGIYTSSLFKYNRDFLLQMGSSLEVSHVYVRPEYQDGPVSDLLHQGIALTLLRNPEIKSIFGSVSMDGSYSSVSKLLAMEYMKKNAMAADDLVEMLQSRTQNISENPMVKPESLKGLVAKLNSMNEVSSTLVSLQGQALPELIKITPEAGGKLLSFTLNKDTGTLDALVIFDTADLSETLFLSRYLGEKIGAEYKESQMQFQRGLQYER